MERWQRDHIGRNIDKLVENTICDTNLLLKLKAAGILGKADLDKIECERRKLDKCKMLYDIVETRTNGYVAMLKALAAANQTGSFDILMAALVERVFSKLQVSYCGNEKALVEILTEDEITSLGKTMQGTLERGKFLDLCLKAMRQDEALKLVNDYIPPPVPYYIPRRLSKRLKLNPDIFKLDGPDVFVFKGVDRAKLYEHVTSYLVASSLSQVDKLTSRFILLDHEDDWREIRASAKVPVHLIKPESDEGGYVVEETSGGSLILNRYLTLQGGSRDGEETATITEEEFANEVFKPNIRGVCICDLPGMGKSVLLANLARKMSNIHPERMVAFIQLSQLTKFATENTVSKRAEHNGISNILLQYMAASPVGGQILSKILNKEEIRLELFFDGLDEVQENHLAFTKEIITNISKALPNTRIYVTSRTHVRHELEASLGAIAYDILPFSKENQVDFLQNSWKNDSVDDVKLTEFAVNCLEVFAKNLSKKEQEMTGIPIQCHLISEVYCRPARRYANPTRSITLADSCKFENSIADVYDQYIQLRFSRSDTIKDTTESDDIISPNEVVASDTGENSIKPETDMMHMLHEKLALGEIFPDLLDKLDWFYSSTVCISEMTALSIGLLERRHNGNLETLEFRHRTLAEYLVADLISRVLINEHHSELYDQKFRKKIIKYAFMKGRGVFSTFRFKVPSEFYITSVLFDNTFPRWVLYNYFDFPLLVYFCNARIKNYTLALSKQNLSISAVVFPAPTPKFLLSALEATLRLKYEGIFKLLKSIFLEIRKFRWWKMKVKIMITRRSERIMRILNTAAYHCNMYLINELFSLFSVSLKFDLSDLCTRLPNNVTTPLHYAVRAGNLEIVQFLLTKASTNNRKIIYTSTVGTNSHNSAEIQRQLTILQYLLSKDGILFTEANSKHGALVSDILLTPRIHLDLIKYLVKHGANPRAVHSKETIVHRAATYMSPSDFHELCRFLVEDCEASYLFSNDDIQYKSPSKYILESQRNLKLETLDFIFNASCTYLNDLRDGGFDLFLSACRYQNCAIFSSLVKRGVNYNYINEYGQNALHVIVDTHWNVVKPDIINYLISLGIDHRKLDMNGKTPLHLASETLAGYEKDLHKEQAAAQKLIVDLLTSI